MVLNYLAALTSGFVRALFWSGGWYWRIPLLVAALPEAREEIKPVLEFLCVATWPSWVFYLMAASVAALIYAWRIAYLETPKLEINFEAGCLSYEVVDFIHRDQHLSDILPPNECRRFMIGVRNNYPKDGNNCLVQIVQLYDTNREGNYAFIPLGLRTEHQRLQDRRGRFNLSYGQEEKVEVVAFIEDDPGSKIKLLYESPESMPTTIPADRQYICIIAAYGFGRETRARFRFYVDDEGRLRFEPYSEFQEATDALIVRDQKRCPEVST